MAGRSRQPEASRQQAHPAGRALWAGMFALLAAVAVACFLPLLRYFFAQDDFTLMYQASTAPREMLEHIFGSDPGQFRPLSRWLYFAGMYETFGLNPLPYHAVSVALHVVNAGLLFLLFRRLRLQGPAAFVAASLFALSTGFFHVIAWVSCIQQLLAELFFLLTLLFGTVAFDGGHNGRRWLSVAAYIAALSSMEQVFGAPLLLVLIGYLGLGLGRRRPLSRVLRVLWPHLLMLLVYAVFLLGWKGPPAGGTYEVGFGGNVLLNLKIYLGWLFDQWVILPGAMQNPETGLTVSHVLLAALVAYHLTRRRFAQVTFALSCLLFTLLPLFFLSYHTFYLHTYVPSLATLYLAGLAVGDAVGRTPLTRTRMVTFCSLLVLVFGSLTFAFVKRNEKAVISPSLPLRRSFVLRRALAAQRSYEDILEKAGDVRGIDHVYMVYLMPEGRDERKWNNDNVKAAWGEGGAAIKLFVERPELEVSFHVFGDEIADLDTERSLVFFFGDYGDCFTYEEVTGRPLGESD